MKNYSINQRQPPPSELPHWSYPDLPGISRTTTRFYNHTRM